MAAALTQHWSRLPNASWCFGTTCHTPWPGWGMDGTSLRALHTLAEPQHGAVHRRQLNRVAATRSARRWLRDRGVVCAVTRDVFVMAGSRATWERGLWTTLLEAGERSQASHRTAAG